MKIAVRFKGTFEKNIKNRKTKKTKNLNIKFIKHKNWPHYTFRSNSNSHWQSEWTPIESNNKRHPTQNELRSISALPFVLHIPTHQLHLRNVKRAIIFQRVYSTALTDKGRAGGTFWYRKRDLGGYDIFRRSSRMMLSGSGSPRILIREL